MITRLTDLTLRCLDTTGASDELLREFYTLLFSMGADLVEVDLETARRLGEALNPSRTVLHLENPAEAIPGFVRYSCRISSGGGSLPFVREVRMNDIRELPLLSRYKEEPALRIVGLDDLILQDFGRVLDRLRRELPPSVEFCPTNACGCASALLTEWLVGEGGNGVGSFAGAGGYAPLEETLLALRLTRKYQRHSDLGVLSRLRELYELLTGVRIPNHKAVLGREIFAVESGVHVDGILKNTSVYEPYSPELVGANRRFAIGKHTGRAGLLYVLKELGYVPDSSQVESLLQKVRMESVRLHRGLSAEELLTLAAGEGAL